MYVTLVQSCGGCGVTGVYVSDRAPTEGEQRDFQQKAGGMWCISVTTEQVDYEKLVFLGGEDECQAD